MWHAIFITAHAVTATIALLAGLIAMPRARLVGSYLASLVAMQVFLLLAIAAEWAINDVTTRLVFIGLAVLGAVMVWRGLRAVQIRPRRGDSPSARYVYHLGFTLIALVDAFLVVAVLNAGAPGWAVASTAVLVAAIGHVVLQGARRRIVASLPAQTHPAA